MAFTPSFGAGDAVAAQTLDKAQGFLNWLDSNGQTGKGIITEMGIPGSSGAATDPIPGSGTGAKFDIRWDNVVQQWYEQMNRKNVGVTAWNASNWRVDLRAYENEDGSNLPMNYRTTFSSVIENNLTGKNGVTNPRGINLAGAEFSDRGPDGRLDRSHTEQPGAGYYYPIAEDVQMLKSRGLDIIRLPIRWERVQPTLKQPLSTSEMAKLDAVITAAGSAGIKILLDVHNYARYDTIADGSSGGVYVLGGNAPATHNGQNVGGTMISCFNDLWSRLATHYKGFAGMWGYDLCNEPHDCPNGASDWKEASRQAVEAIRAIDTDMYIAIEGYLYASVPGWVNENGSSAWQTQIIPSGQPKAGQARNNDDRILWNGHHYFDQNYNGGFEDSYDSELTSAQNAGYSSYTTTGYTAPATNNTLQSGIRTASSSTFDDTGAFSGQYDGVIKGTNGVIIPSTVSGMTGNVMRINATATSDEGGVRKSFSGNVIRIFQFDFFLPGTPAMSSTNNMTIAHAWKDNSSDDFVEVRCIGVGSGYQLGLTIPSGTYAFNNTLGTNIAYGAPVTVKVVVTDTAVSMYLNGGTTAEATISGSYAGVNVGLLALGKFYGTSYVGSMYYDNFNAGTNSTYYAPPNGGRLPATPGGGGGGGGGGTTPVTTTAGLLLFI